MTPAITELVALDVVVRAIKSVAMHCCYQTCSDAPPPGKKGAVAGLKPGVFSSGIQPYMTVAVPIERFAGDVVGVLVAEVNLKYIWEVVSRIKVGQAGYAYVVSREGSDRASGH